MINRSGSVITDVIPPKVMATQLMREQIPEISAQNQSELEPGSVNENPYLSPTGITDQPRMVPPKPRARILARFGLALILCFVVMPGLCIWGWMLGYGPGGWHNLTAGAEDRPSVLSGVFTPCGYSFLFVSPLVVFSRRRWAKVLVGTLILAVLLASFLIYFSIAAAIASV